MTLTEYIRANADGLIGAWVRESPPASIAAGGYSDEQLSDRLRELLLHIAEAIHDLPDRNADAAVYNPADFTAWGRQHAEERLRQGYSLDDVIAEFCGLRELIMQGWNQLPRRDSDAACRDLMRFNRALDLGLTESVRRYAIDQTHARDLFTGMLVHDLRNPLSSISGLSALLVRAPDSAGGIAAIGDKLGKASERMKDIIEEMLDVLQARLGRSLPLKRGRASLLEICNRVVEELRDQHPDSRIRIATSGDVAGVWDQARLFRVLSNLVSNALKYRSANTVVDIDITGRDQNVGISVTNEGPAISGEDLVSMFEPMVRLRQHASDGREATRGLGLGLYVARQLVLAHGGSIEAKSESGSNTFTVLLPRSG